MNLLRRQEKWKLFFEEVSQYIGWANRKDDYGKIEDICLNIFNDAKINVEDRVGYGAAIFSINKFYNPKSNIEDIFIKILSL